MSDLAGSSSNNKLVRPKTAFAFFIDVVQQGGGQTIDFTDPAIKARYIAMWNQLPMEKQQIFAQKELQDRQRLEMEMQASASTKQPADSAGNEKSTRKRKRQNKDKDPNKPKRPLTAFFCFSIEERKKVQESNPSMNIIEMSKHLGSIWRGMDTEKKAPYLAKAEADKARYEKEMAAYGPVSQGQDTTPKRNRTSLGEDSNVSAGSQDMGRQYLPQASSSGVGQSVNMSTISPNSYASIQHSIPKFYTPISPWPQQMFHPNSPMAQRQASTSHSSPSSTQNLAYSNANMYQLQQHLLLSNAYTSAAAAVGQPNNNGNKNGEEIGDLMRAGYNQTQMQNNQFNAKSGNSFDQ